MNAESNPHLQQLHKQRRQIWRGLHSGKLNEKVYKPILGKTLDLILNLQNRINNE